MSIEDFLPSPDIYTTHEPRTPQTLIRRAHFNELVEITGGGTEDVEFPEQVQVIRIQATEIQVGETASFTLDPGETFGPDADYDPPAKNMRAGEEYIIRDFPASVVRIIASGDATVDVSGYVVPEYGSGYVFENP